MVSWSVSIFLVEVGSIHWKTNVPGERMARRKTVISIDRYFRNQAFLGLSLNQGEGPYIVYDERGCVLIDTCVGLATKRVDYNMRLFRAGKT